MAGNGYRVRGGRRPLIIYGMNEALSDWVSMNVLGATGLYDECSKAIGNMVDGKIVAAVTFNQFRTRPDKTIFTLEMGIYSCDRRWATKDFLRAVFEYPFVQLGLDRVSTACSAERPEVINFNEKLGFIREGYHRRAFPLGGDSVSFSMLKEECKWIKHPEKRE